MWASVLPKPATDPPMEDTRLLETQNIRGEAAR